MRKTTTNTGEILNYSSKIFLTNLICYICNWLFISVPLISPKAVYNIVCIFILRNFGPYLLFSFFVHGSCSRLRRQHASFTVYHIGFNKNVILFMANVLYCFIKTINHFSHWKLVVLKYPHVLCRIPAPSTPPPSKTPYNHITQEYNEQ